ncbi:hypothetical protein O6H91_12G101200 [Diphasiastrum complanatum]|uniref:Uncharacterized protein n=1 Tax=Diphasiastrum complanatum TaxID=34168 RepID=A0ACC2C592_DIPCM|nr:hypothetical protein O6H91_12G101200 [Diphasiastrum complanatum]
MTILKKLEESITSSDHTLKQEVDKMRAEMTSQIKHIMMERDEALQELERKKLIAATAEGQLASKEKLIQQEKEASERVLNSHLVAYRTELMALQAESESLRKELMKLKKKHMEELEEYDLALSRKTTVAHKLELAKADLEEKIFLLTAEQIQLQEKLKLFEDREKVLEKRIDLDKLRNSEVLSFEQARHLEEKKHLEGELRDHKLLIDSTQKHLQEVQSEMDRRKHEAEKRLLGVEIASVDWIRQQFTALRAENSLHQIRIGCSNLSQ